MAGKSKELKANKTKIIELEGKRKEDNAWHDCEVSLSSSDSTYTSLYVHFASFKNDENDVIRGKEEAISRLRVRSTNLSDGECMQVKEGEAVIALQKTWAGRKYFFDAEVEKVKRFKHSSRVFCRCDFEIRWLGGEMKGERTTVSASSIRRLVQENIAKHPIVSTFFEALKSGEQAPLSPELPVIIPEDSDVEIDIHARLEQQIEEITKSADTSKNATMEGLLCKKIKGNAVNSKRRHENVNASDGRSWYSKNDNGDVPVRKSTRKRNVASSERVPREPITLNAAAFLRLEKRPRLSPLAARAALAAAVWDLPLGKSRMDDLNNVLEAKEQDSGQMAQSKFRDQLDKVSLNLSDTYFDIRHRSKGKRDPKIATSIDQGKSSKQSSSNKFHTNQVHHGHPNRKRSRIVSSDYSRLQRTNSVSISEKQEVSSDIASTAKGSSATADINKTQQSLRKRQREASKEVSSIRSRSKHLRVAPTRSSPRFHVSPVSICNKQETSGSVQIREKNEPIITDNPQRKSNGNSAATKVKGKKEKKPPHLTDQEPDSTMVSINPLQAKSMFKNNETEQYATEIRKETQQKGFNGCKENYKAESGGPKKAKHLPNDDCVQNINGAITEGSKDGDYSKQVPDTASVGAKKIKRTKTTISNHVEYPSLTNGSTEGTVEGLHNKRATKAQTSRARRSEDITSRTQLENSNRGDETERKSPKRKMTSSKKGKYSGTGNANGDKNLKADIQVFPEMKMQPTRSSVMESSPRLQLLPRTRSQRNKICQN